MYRSPRAICGFITIDQKIKIVTKANDAFGTRIANLLPKSKKLKLKIMKRIVLVLTLQIFSVALLTAQVIKGSIQDEKGKPVTAATVSLLSTKDTSVVKLVLSKEGVYGFEQVKSGTYLISISYVGYKTILSPVFAFKGEPVVMPELILSEPVSKLQGVTVVARKPVVEVKANKTILNVEGSINATASDALELLRKSPGVTVDNDENLSMNGKNGVKVYIDNKPTPLNGQELSNYLKSIPAAQIEAIEIIHNPSASYEAAGNAGIINIRLKKNKTIGLNGSVSGGVSASKNTRYETGFSLNSKDKNLNVFSTYNYNMGKIESDFNLRRIILDTSFNQQSKIMMEKNTHTFKTGIDYTLSSKSTLGVMVNGNFSNPKTSNNNVTPIAYKPTSVVNKILVAENFTKQQNNNINTNFNYAYRDTAGRSLVLNADYGYYLNKQNQSQPNSFFDATGKNELYQRNYLIVSPTTIDIYSLKADYEQNFAKGRLAIGGKIGYVKTNNDFNQYDVDGSSLKLDKNRSNVFGYKENVNAAYVNYSRDLKGLSIQAGIRGEQTFLQGKLKNYKKAGNDYVEETSAFKRDYTDFFPSVSITIAPKTQNQFALAYSRRIDRPIYQDLNPFEYRINEYHFHKGSIDLRPQYSNTVSLTHTYKYKLNTRLSYSHVTDMFGQIVDTAQGVTDAD